MVLGIPDSVERILVHAYGPFEAAPLGALELYLCESPDYQHDFNGRIVDPCGPLSYNFKGTGSALDEVLREIVPGFPGCIGPDFRVESEAPVASFEIEVL